MRGGPHGRGATRPPLRSALPILAITTGFLLFSAATLDDFGLTWDEGVKMYDDASYAEVVKRIAPYDPRVLHIPGYFYVVDTLRSLYAKALSDATGADPVLVHHSFNVLLSAGCLVLLYALALALSGSRALGAVACGALLLTPQFLGHSQNNPKDLPAALLFLLVAWLVVRASRAPRWPGVLAASAAYGVALTTRVSAVLLPLVLGAFFALRRREALRQGARWLPVAAVASLLFALASFPALWIEGTGVFRTAAERYEVLRGLDVKILYLGHLYRWDSLPWHFSLVHLLVTLPLSHLFFLAAGVASAWRWRERSPGRADAAWLAILWVAALFGADLLAPLHYDGIRHLLAALPAVALLVACGALLCLEALEGAAARAGWPRHLPAAALTLLALLTAGALTAYHPYQTAYLNPIARALAGEHPEEWIEVEYWGAPYKEGAEWLGGHAEPGSVVHFVIGGGQRAGEDIARFYLDLPVVRGGDLALFEDETTPRFLMFITRRAWYDDFVNDVRARYAPVHTVERGGATLLEIYSNRSGRRP